MLTPQEVSEHAFAKASFGGYNMSMVDEFLDALTADYAALYKENAVLKSKMKVLVDKVEEYRTTEDAMRKALLSAQRMADEMIQEAQRKKVTLLAEAEEAAREKIDSLRQEIGAEAHRLAVAKDNTADFLTKLNVLCAREMDFLARFSQITAASQPVPDPVVATAQDIQSSVEEAVRENPAYIPPTDGENPALEVSPPADARPVAEEVLAAVPPPVYVAPPAVAAPVAQPAPAPVDAVPETEGLGGLYDDITAFAAQVKAISGMEEQHFAITLGGPKPARVADPLSAVDEPTQRIDFDHLQFGKDYEIK